MPKVEESSPMPAEAKRLPEVVDNPVEDSPSIELEPEVVEVIEPQYPLKDSAKEYWLQALGYLQIGEEAGARWSIEQALSMQPNYSRAVKLLSQLDEDPISLLGDESFNQRLEYGDSLSKLAAKYLNDPLKFYLLARYNGIENPSRIKVGQLIRIPGHRLPPPEQDLAISDTSYHEAKDLFDNGQYEEAISILEGSLDEMGLSDDELRAINKLLTDAFIHKANDLEKHSQYLSAKETLSRATELQPGNLDIQFHLESLNARLELEQHYQQALKADADGRTEEAIVAFDKILAVDPDYRDARTKRDELFNTLADHIYKRALLAQRKQNLSRAIDLWDQFLAMVPDNENAKFYRAKAARMLAGLQKVATQ